MICQNCQTPNPDGAQYCQRCGQPLRAAAASAPPEAQAPTSPTSLTPSFGSSPNVLYAAPAITPSYTEPSSSLPKNRDIPISSTGTKYATIAGSIAVISFFLLPYVNLGLLGS